MRLSQLLRVCSRSSTAESSTARGVLRQGCAEGTGVEVRPELVGEDELRVGELPQQEVRDAQLAARADEQIRVGKRRRVEVRGEHVLVDLGGLHPALDDSARRLDELGAAAVVERDPEVDLRV